MFQLVVFFFVPVVFLCHKGPISKSAQRAFSMYHLIHWPTIYSDIRYQQTIGIIYSLQPRTKSNDRYFNQTSSSSKAMLFPASSSPALSVSSSLASSMVAIRSMSSRLPLRLRLRLRDPIFEYAVEIQNVEQLR